MYIFVRLSKFKERFIEMKGYTPTAVYLGKQEYDALADWCKDSLLYELDKTSNIRNRVIGLDIYLVDADSHMAMI